MVWKRLLQLDFKDLWGQMNCSFQRLRNRLQIHYIITIESVWCLYLRRFTIDHWYRFLKQRLHWTVPNLSTPKQCERWSDLMPFITWELWLARDIVTDNPLPWQKSVNKLTPGRVAQAMGGVFAVIGTPAVAPNTSKDCPLVGNLEKSVTVKTDVPLLKKQ